MTARLLPAVLVLLPLAAQAGPFADALQATLSHPQTRAARLQADAARAQESAIAGRYWGQANLNAGWRRYEGPHVVGYFAPGSGPLPPIDRSIASAGLNYSLPVDVFGAIAASRERAGNDAQAAELAARQQTLGKLHQTATAWLGLQALSEREAAVRAFRQRVEATAARTQAEVRLGKTAAVEAKNAQSELARLAAEEAALAGRIAEARAGLLEASGVEAPAALSGQILVPAWEAIAADATLPVNLADARGRAAQAQAREAKRALYPNLNLVADYTDNWGNGAHRDTWSLGAVVSLPLGATPYRQAEAQRLAAEAAGASREAARREVERQIAVLKSAYDAALADAAAVEQEIAYRQDLVAVQHEMYRLGSQTLENLYRHERDLLDAVSRRAEARARAALAWSAAQTLAGLDSATYIAKLDPK
jgi:outer membrane protein TolC